MVFVSANTSAPAGFDIPSIGTQKEFPCTRPVSLHGEQKGEGNS